MRDSLRALMTVPPGAEAMNHDVIQGAMVLESDSIEMILA